MCSFSAEIVVPMVSSLSLLVSFREHNFWILNLAHCTLVYFGTVSKHGYLRNAHEIASGSIREYGDVFKYRVESGLEIALCINSTSRRLMFI